jgi:hypothetical protein
MAAVAGLQIGEVGFGRIADEDLEAVAVEAEEGELGPGGEALRVARSPGFLAARRTGPAGQ